MKQGKILVIIFLLVFLFSVSIAYAEPTRLSITGRTRYSLKGGQVTVYCREIANNSPAGTHSGSIRVQLWATRSQYTGGTLNGWKIAEIQLGVLYGGKVFREVNRTVYYKAPPPGYYYMTIVVAEYNHGKYYTADWKNYPNRQKFR